MSVHHRNSVTETTAPYQPLSQVETPEVHPSTPLLLSEDEEVALAEDFVAQERVASHDWRIWWIHFILGCAILLPWNALITATPYFMSRLEGTSLQSTFSSYLSTTFTIANFLFLAHATATTQQATNSRRVKISLAHLTVLSFLLTLSTFINTLPGLFFAFVMLNGIIQAAAGSYLQTSVIAVASLFGPTAIQAIMSGQAAIGVAVSAVEVLSSMASIRAAPTPEAIAASQPEARAAFIFFGLSTIFLVLSIGAHIWLTKLPAYMAIMEQYSHTKDIPHSHSRHPSLSDEPQTPVAESQSHVPGEKKHQLIRVAKSNLIYNLAVAYVFIITLAVFPPITISIKPTNPATHPLVFSTVHFLVFNVGDWLGRYICSFPRLLVWSARRLLSFSVARTLFIPIFLMCNIQRSSTVSAASQAIISSDLLYMFILLLFGLTNGYVSSLCMMAAPSVEHNPRLKGRLEDVDVAATVASFCLVGGLAVGSFTSFGVKAAIVYFSEFLELTWDNTL
ncbi:hypothetical protein NM688_g9182 [Phlebia brevispora]|uniref:Uncharacterized protein n=1 Tax=Phlebia brevispora TaxID=194682 RepID=A0ACC1RIJ0_9APHY|nr:hypothetical protein NM688_g9182 [Phlebia brevispora]